MSDPIAAIRERAKRYSNTNAAGAVATLADELVEQRVNQTNVSQ